MCGEWIGEELRLVAGRPAKGIAALILVREVGDLSEGYGSGIEEMFRR